MPCHLIVFEREEEAAAFVAALSRVLSGPNGPADAEVWRDASGTAARIYLSDSALDAAQRAFSPVPVASVITRAELPNEAERILSDDDRAAWGIDDARRRMTDSG